MCEDRAVTAPISKDEFVAAYLHESQQFYPDLTAEEFFKHRHAVPCNCEDATCEGWAMVPLEFETHNGRRG